MIEKNIYDRGRWETELENRIHWMRISICISFNIYPFIFPLLYPHFSSARTSSSSSISSLTKCCRQQTIYEPFGHIETIYWDKNFKRYFLTSPTQKMLHLLLINRVKYAKILNCSWKTTTTTLKYFHEKSFILNKLKNWHTHWHAQAYTHNTLKNTDIPISYPFLWEHMEITL